jgi:acyl-CoA synthetase (NDP forming)
LSAAKKKVAEIISLAVKDGRSELLELESKQMLAAWGLPVKRTELAKDPDEAVRVAREIRYPLVIKIASPDIPRKSEARCVKIGIGSELELRQAFGEIVNNAREYKPNANILGVTVQEYLPSAREVVVGALQDKSFGATVWFGLLGSWFDVLGDTSFRLAPLSAEDALEMIQEVRGYPVLQGIRGEPSADIDALVGIVQKVGQLAHEFPEIVKLEIDPIFAFEAGKGAVVVNARVLLGGSK